MRLLSESSSGAEEWSEAEWWGRVLLIAAKKDGGLDAMRWLESAIDCGGGGTFGGFSFRS